MPTGESDLAVPAGQVVAITGGARGIGHETAKLLAAAGAKVAIGDLDLALAEESIKGLPGVTAAFELDVTDCESFERFIDAVERTLGPIDVLVNNAGVMWLSPLTEEPDEISERQYRVNVHGPMLGMKLAIPRMLARGRGHIVNIASSAGRFGVPGAVMYSASKFAVVGMTEAAASEYADTPLNFSAVCPVVVDTELTRGVTERTRFVPILKPADVAEAIVETIRKPKAIVYVPSSVRFTYLLALMLPRRVRRLLERFTRADRVLTKVDPEARRSYVQRAFGSRPR